jgi:hypothetical protein
LQLRISKGALLISIHQGTNIVVRTLPCASKVLQDSIPEKSGRHNFILFFT